MQNSGTLWWLEQLEGGGIGHSPLLDQKDGDQHQQDEDQNPGADPGYLHHPVRLLGRVGDDFRFLGGT